jgi:hypothetical protein
MRGSRRAHYRAKSIYASSFLTLVLLGGCYAMICGVKPDHTKTNRAVDTQETSAAPETPAARSDPAPIEHRDSREKSVHVRGYYRKDGTYVAPYDRRPRQ